MRCECNCHDDAFLGEHAAGVSVPTDARYHRSQPVPAPEPSARLREAAQRIVDWVNDPTPRSRGEALRSLRTRIEVLSAVLAATPQDPKENR